MKKYTFGERFKECRMTLQLTQEELAKLFNKTYTYSFSKSSISMYENNKQVPEVDVLEKWANYFDVSVDYLLGRTDVRNESYYHDPEAAAYAQEIFEDPDLRILLDAKRKMPKEDMQFIVNLVQKMTPKEGDY